MNMSFKNKLKKSIGRFWHTHDRAFKHYSSILNVFDITHKIPTLINNGFYRDVGYDQVPKRSRQVGCGYYLVSLKGKEYIVVFDQFDNEVKTLLPKKEDSMGFLVDIFEDEEVLNIRYKISQMVGQMIVQMTLELDRFPTISELSKESGISEKILREHFIDEE